jgi:hypothetical protein
MRRLNVVFLASAVALGALGIQFSIQHAVVPVPLTEPVLAGLTDHKSIEIFSGDGTLLYSRPLSGSGAVSGSNLISVAYGDFLPLSAGSELVVLRDSGLIELYGDPTFGRGDLERVAWRSLYTYGRAVQSIDMNRDILAAFAVPDTSPVYYLYGYKEGYMTSTENQLNRFTLHSLGGTLLHAPAVGMISDDSLSQTEGVDWGLLYDDGFMEIYSDDPVGGAVERQSWFYADTLSGGINNLAAIAMDDSQLKYLTRQKQIKFFTYDGTDYTYQPDSDIQLSTDSSLTDICSYEKQTREEPLRDLPVTQTLSVTNYGAFPDDDENDRAAIQSALNALAALSGPAELIFPEGKYVLDMARAVSGESNYLLGLEDAENKVVDFNGSELQVKSPSRGFIEMDGCENIIVRNGTVDYDPVPHSEGIITAKNQQAGTIDWQVRSGFPAPDQEYFNLAADRWGYLLDPAVAGRLKSDAITSYRYTTVTSLGNGLYRIGLATTVDSQWNMLEVGDRFCLLARDTGSFFRVVDSIQVTAMNLTSYNVPAGHYVAVWSEALNVIGCRSPMKDGFWKGGNADGVHCQSCRVGPWIEDCLFEGISDDSLVIYARPFSVINQTSEASFEIGWYSTGSRISERDLRAGDILDFFDPSNGVVICTATVSEYDYSTKTVTVDSPLEGLDPGLTLHDTQIWSRAMGRGFVIRNNILQNSRRYGVYLKASDGLIQSNRFTGLSSCAFALQNNPAVPNGPFCRNVDIKDNVIDQCGFESGFISDNDVGALRVLVEKIGYGEVSGLAHEKILIENNQFFNLRKPAVFLRNVSRGVVRGNTLDGNALPGEDIVVLSSENISIE